MRTLLATFMAAGIVVSTAAAQAGPPDDRPLPVLGGKTTVSRIEPRLSAGAARIAGKPVEVRCWSVADWRQLAVDNDFPSDGIAYEYRGRVHLGPPVCAALVPFLYSNARPKKGTLARRRLALALSTLAHETQHARGVDAESEAECVGMQRVRPLARFLGGSKDYAAGLAVFTWRELYPPQPDEYRSPECRNGGALDVNPASPSWP